MDTTHDWVKRELRTDIEQGYGDYWLQTFAEELLKVAEKKAGDGTGTAMILRDQAATIHQLMQGR